MFTRLTPIGVIAANRSHCQTICERVKRIAVPAEPFKKLDVRWSGIWAGGMIANTTPEYWIASKLRRRRRAQSHGTNQPGWIGHAITSGCIRLTNEDIIDLYSRVKMGAPVIVLGPKQGASRLASAGSSHSN